MTNTTAATSKPVHAKELKQKRYALGESRYLGLLYISPWIIGFLIFTAYPIIASFVLSFTNYDLFTTPKVIGFANYTKMFADKTFQKAMSVTFKYVVLEVPLKIVFSLFIAIILSKKLKGINFFRTAYYIPSILGSNVAIAVLWKFIFQSDGLVNQVIGLFGGQSVAWFGEQMPALFTIVLLRVWEFGSTMVIFLAAIKSLPQDVYEAAAVDGCKKVRQFFTITIPLLSPTIFFNFVMQLINAFQEFNAPYLITKGGPQYGTYLLPMYIYDMTFGKYKMGYASAMSWVLFIIVMFFTILTFKYSKYWVFYSDEGQGGN